MTNELSTDEEFAALEQAISEADAYRREAYAKPKPKLEPAKVEPKPEPKPQGPARTSAAALAQFTDAELDASIETLAGQVEETEQKLETLRLQLAAARLEKRERPQKPKRIDLAEAVEMLVEARTGSGKTAKSVEAWLAKRGNGAQ